MTKRNRGRQSHTQSRVRRRHPARSKQQTQIPFPLDEEVNNHFARLRKEPREHGRNKRRIRRQRRHERANLHLSRSRDAQESDPQTTVLLQISGRKRRRVFSVSSKTRHPLPRRNQPFNRSDEPIIGVAVRCRIRGGFTAEGDGVVVVDRRR